LKKAESRRKKGRRFWYIKRKVRHYINYDADGVARIYLSRLVDFEADKNVYILEMVLITLKC